MSRCERSDLPEDQCAHCRGDGEAVAVDWAAGRPFPARYDGRCARCQQPIWVDDPIAALVDDSEYVHKGCAA
jgi:hypothetical protein